MWWSRDKGSLEDRIRKRGLERVADQIKGSVRECIRFKTHPANEDAIARGASKFGGWPDLPEGIEWPGGSATPMLFFAQINTRDLPDFDGRTDLPDDTLLSFFYDAATTPRGYHPRDRGGWKIVPLPLGEPLKRREIVGVNPIQLCAFTARKDTSLPDPASDEVRSWKMEEDEYDAYAALYDGLMPKRFGSGENHQLLGYASTIQGDMHVLCELASQGIYWKTVVGPDFYDDPKWQPVHEAGKEWRLLLQIDSDRRALLNIDGGRLYFYIRNSALRARAFDEAWVVAQINDGSDPP
jgi:uncharacterized protein YwqG